MNKLSLLFCVLCLVPCSLSSGAENWGQRTISLQEAVDIALKNNPLILQTQEKIKEAKAQILQAKAGKNPYVDFNILSTKYQQNLSSDWQFPESIIIPQLKGEGNINIYGVVMPVSITIPPTNISLPQPVNRYFSSDVNYDTRLTLKQAIYTGGKLEGVIHQAKIQEEISKLEEEKTKREIILQVKKAYYNFLKAKKLLYLVEESVSYSEKHLSDAELRFKLGKVAEFDVIRAKIKLKEKDMEKAGGENALLLAMTIFNNILGVEGDIYEPKEEENLTEEKYQNLDLQSLIQIAVEEREEIKQINKSKEIAKIQEKIAKANKRPNVGVAGNYNYTGDDFPPKNKNWNISLGCNINLYDSQDTKAKITQARANFSQVENSKKNIKRHLELEVKTAYYKLKDAEEKIKVLKENIDAAKQALSIANVRYNAGLATSLEVLDSQLVLVKIEGNYIQTIYDLKIAKAELERAVGKEI